MKKLLSLVIVLTMTLTVCIPSFATGDTPAEDITSSVKFATVIEVYTDKLPVVRTDAQFISSDTYINAQDEGFTAPGSGVRNITILDLPFENFFNDRFVASVKKELGAVDFMYPSVWANNYDGNSAPGKLVYNVEIPKDGIYEFVVVGCANIKEKDVDNDGKDRGFTISVDGQNKKQVNISDTKLTFRDYDYSYTVSAANDSLITTKNGVNSKQYQVGYVYNIQYELTKGTHTIEYYHLEYSGTTKTNGDNSSRLNFMGVYVQEYLTDAELELYTYPPVVEITEPEATTKTTENTTAAPIVTSSAPAKTTAPEKTDAPVSSDAPSTDASTKDDPEEKSGCGSLIGGGAVVLVAIFGSAVIASKRK